MWAHGPFPCGSHSDLTIFRLAMKNYLQEGEKVIADRGYMDCMAINPNSELSSYRRYNACVRARHETFNGRLKSFNVLGGNYRHALNRHSDLFFSVTNLVYLSTVNGAPLFEVAV